jgi:hypothetical protein
MYQLIENKEQCNRSKIPVGPRRHVDVDPELLHRPQKGVHVSEPQQT